ncbi:MAG: hypothetical protein GQ557_01850 [Mycoplasmataceae bacterium]|nr:hypothetical protein [Mycoplasmataceae bacterium]
MKKTRTRKLIFSSLFIGSLIIIPIFGVLKYVDFNNITENNQMSIHIGDQKSTFEVENGEVTNLVTTYEDPVDPVDPTTPVDPVDPETSTNDSIKQKQANWGQIAFMTAALSGTYGFDGDNSEVGTPDVYEQTLLDPNGGDWISNDLTNRYGEIEYNNLYGISSFIKFYSETAGNPIEKVRFTEYVDQLIITEGSSQGLNQVSKDLNMNDIQDFNDLSTVVSNDFWTNAIVQEDWGYIINTETYRMDVTKFLYTFTYLWQYSTSSAYDYNITESIVGLRPQFVWVQDFDFDSIGHVNGTPNEYVEDMVGDSGTSTTSGNNWNDWSTDPQLAEDEISYDNYTKLDPSDASPVGYIGIQNRGSANVVGVGDDFWSLENGYDFSDDQTRINQNSMLVNAENGDGTIYDDGSNYVFEEGENGIEKSIAHTGIIPFVFPTNYDDTTGIADKWEYSIYGDVNTNTDVVTQIDGENIDLTTHDSIFDAYANLFPTLINLNEGGEALAYSVSELYIMYSIYDSTGGSLIINNSYNYWNHKGFYIELEGSYYDDYHLLLPALIQKSE